MASKKKRELPKNKEEAMENLVCAAVRLVFPGRQVDWNMNFSLVETQFVSELRVAINEYKKFL